MTRARRVGVMTPNRGVACGRVSALLARVERTGSAQYVPVIAAVIWRLARSQAGDTI